MSEDAHKLALRNAVLEWQRRHGIQDGDPVLATLELWEIYLNHRYEHGSITQPPTYAEFRETLDHTDRLTKRLGTLATEMTQEVRAMPKLPKELFHDRVTALVATAISALLAGVVIGKFLL